jgi:hypothetical protein
VRILLLALPLLLLPGAALANQEGGKEISIEDFLQNLSTVPGVVSRKDPFIAAGPPFDVPQSKEDEDGGIAMGAPVLERYPVNQYSIVATLTGDQYPRALVRLPESEQSRVLIVREKDKLGNRGGVVAKIHGDGVVVMQSLRSPLGFVDKSEVILPVGGGEARTVQPEGGARRN